MALRPWRDSRLPVVTSEALQRSYRLPADLFATPRRVHHAFESLHRTNRVYSSPPIGDAAKDKFCEALDDVLAQDTGVPQVYLDGERVRREDAQNTRALQERMRPANDCRSTYEQSVRLPPCGDVLAGIPVFFHSALWSDRHLSILDAERLHQLVDAIKGRPSTSSAAASGQTAASAQAAACVTGAFGTSGAFGTTAPVYSIECECTALLRTAGSGVVLNALPFFPPNNRTSHEMFAEMQEMYEGRRETYGCFWHVGTMGYCTKDNECSWAHRPSFMPTYRYWYGSLSFDRLTSASDESDGGHINAWVLDRATKILYRLEPHGVLHRDAEKHALVDRILQDDATLNHYAGPYRVYSVRSWRVQWALPYCAAYSMWMLEFFFRHRDTVYGTFVDVLVGKSDELLRRQPHILNLYAKLWSTHMLTRRRIEMTTTQVKYQSTAAPYFYPQLQQHYDELERKRQADEAVERP